MSRMVKAMKPRALTQNRRILRITRNPAWGRLPSWHRRSRVWGHGQSARILRSLPAGCRAHSRARRARLRAILPLPRAAWGRRTASPPSIASTSAGFNLGDFRPPPSPRHRLRDVGRGRFLGLRGSSRLGAAPRRAKQVQRNGSGARDVQPQLPGRRQEPAAAHDLRRWRRDAIREAEERPNPHVIPITRKQLEGVRDPMTAAFSLRAPDPDGDPRSAIRPFRCSTARRDSTDPQAERTVKLQKNSSTKLSGSRCRCPRGSRSPISATGPTIPASS